MGTTNVNKAKINLHHKICSAKKIIVEGNLHKNVKSDDSWRKTLFLVQVRTAEAGDSAGASRHCRLLFSGEQLAQVFPRPRRKYSCTFLSINKTLKKFFRNMVPGTGTQLLNQVP